MSKNVIVVTNTITYHSTYIFETFIATIVSKFFNDHTAFQLYMKILKIHLPTIFLTSVNKVFSKQDCENQIRYIIRSVIVGNTAKHLRQ